MIVAKVYKPFPCAVIFLSVGVKSPMVVNRRAAKSAVRRYPSRAARRLYSDTVHIPCRQWASFSNREKNSDTTSEPPPNSATTSAAGFLPPALSRPRRKTLPSESLSHILCSGPCYMYKVEQIQVGQRSPFHIHSAIDKYYFSSVPTIRI